MTMNDTHTDLDAIEFLTQQHRQVDHLWSELQAAHRSGGDAQADVATAIIRMLSQHDAIETQLLYPELKSLSDPRAKELAQDSLDDHQAIRELLKQADGEDPRDEAVFTALSTALADVQQHVAEEESAIFPLLRQECSTERLAELGTKMEAMMSTAPTHPHPSTPNNKIGAAVAGAVTGVVDRARDALKGENG